MAIHVCTRSANCVDHSAIPSVNVATDLINTSSSTEITAFHPRYAPESTINVTSMYSNPKWRFFPGRIPRPNRNPRPRRCGPTKKHSWSDIVRWPKAPLSCFRKHKFASGPATLSRGSSGDLRESASKERRSLKIDNSITLRKLHFSSIVYVIMVFVNEQLVSDAHVFRALREEGNPPIATDFLILLKLFQVDMKVLRSSLLGILKGPRHCQ